MLLTSVIVVLREVLEASLLIALLLALSTMLGLTRRWAGWSLLFGLLGAAVYSLSINTVSEWFDGVGQEIVSASMQIVIYLCLMLISLFISKRTANPHGHAQYFGILMTLVTSLAISREGFEVFAYLYSFSYELDPFIKTLSGGLMGTSIGISTGILLYYMLVSNRFLFTSLGLLALFGSGILSQAILLLIQADWIPSELPLWDTSEWLSETSISGQMLYVLIGYEATPTFIQAAFYFGGLIIMLIPAMLIWNTRLNQAMDH